MQKFDLSHSLTFALHVLHDRLHIFVATSGQIDNDQPIFPEFLSQLAVPAFKAVRIGSAEDVASARRYPGELLLADAKVEGALGGTGACFDWSLASELSRDRKLIVAGGLRPDNVAQAIRALRPWGVDVASGAEEASNPRKKSAARVAELLAAVRGATVS